MTQYDELPFRTNVKIFVSKNIYVIGLVHLNSDSADANGVFQLMFD